MSLQRILICQGSLYMHCCRASPLLQLGLLVSHVCSRREVWGNNMLSCTDIPFTFSDDGDT